MSDEKIVSDMIKYIEDKERKVQASKLANDSQAKTDVVKAILDELEREIKNENKKNRV